MTDFYKILSVLDYEFSINKEYEYHINYIFNTPNSIGLYSITFNNYLNINPIAYTLEYQKIGDDGKIIRAKYHAGYTKVVELLNETFHKEIRQYKIKNLLNEKVIETV